jgi:hypothetical protein
MPTPRLWAFLVTCAVVLVTARVTVAAPEACPSPSANEARAAAVAAAGWLTANQRADGSFSYLVDDRGVEQGGYSNVRHAGATLALYETARATGDPTFLAAADKATEWMRDRLVTRGDWVALSEGSAAPLGGSALMLAALAERRLATGDRANDETMRGLGRFLLAMQRPNGDFSVSYDLVAEEADRVTISQYYAGESLWALARLQNALPDESVRDAALRAATFIATERDDRDFVPVGPLNDHWAAHGFAEMAQWRRAARSSGAGSLRGPSRGPSGPLSGSLTDEEADYARRLYGRFQILMRSEAQKDAGAPYSWVHGPERSSAALGTWVEGQASLAALARVDGRLDDLRRATLDSTECGAGVLVARQRRSDNPRLGGAWFTRGETRVDDQQHAITGLLALADLLEHPGSSG